MAIDMGALILRQSAQRSYVERARCSCCGRSPLAGELVHTLDAGRSVCALCLDSVPATRRTPIRSERVHVGERALAVPRAA